MNLDDPINTVQDFMSSGPEELPEGLDFGDELSDGVDDPLTDEDPEDDADLGDDAESEEADEDEGEESDEDLDDEDEEGEEEGEEGEEDEEGEEGEEGEEEEGEEPEADESDEKPKAKKKGREPAIPKSRFDQALRKARAAEERAANLEAEMARREAEYAEASAPKPLTSEEVKARMAEANDALVSGDVAKAAEIQAEVMASLAPRPVAPQQELDAGDIATRVEAQIEFKTTLKEINSSFPELDENSETFDEELSLEAVDLQQAYMGRGYTVAEATHKAAHAVAKLHDLEDRTTPAEKPERKKADVVRRKQAARTRDKVKKATRAAPKLVGERGETDEASSFDIFSATEEEFMALPQSVQDRLLGNSG